MCEIWWIFFKRHRCKKQDLNHQDRLWCLHPVQAVPGWGKPDCVWQAWWPQPWDVCGKFHFTISEFRYTQHWNSIHYIHWMSQLNILNSTRHNIIQKKNIVFVHTIFCGMPQLNKCIFLFFLLQLDLTFWFLSFQRAYKALPRQRKLEGPLKADVEKMLEVKASKPLIQQHIAATTGQTLILRDLHNMDRKRRHAGASSVDELVNEMKKQPGKYLFLISFFYMPFL